MPDEIRPFPALSYQLTALGGPVSPVLHHALNILIHAANGLLVMAIARRAAGAQRAAATFAGLVFVLLPVHAESVAWITGRVDSMPALFYLATFLPTCASGSAASRRTLRLVARAVLRRAVHQAEHDHDGGDARRLRRHRRRAGRSVPIVAFVRPYVPFALMTAGYLWLRYCSSARSRARARSTPGRSRTFASCSAVTSGTSSPATSNAPAIVVWLAARPSSACGWLARSRAIAVARTARSVPACRVGDAALLRPGLVGDWRAADRGRRLPLAAPRVSRGRRLGGRARHRVSTRRGTLAPSRAWHAWSRRPPRSCCCSTSCRSYRSVREWRTMAAVSHQVVRDVRTAALARAGGKPDHHRRARAELGVGAAVRRAPALSADRL